MSTDAVDRAILATLSRTGTSDLATIVIDTTQLAARATGTRTTLIFVTFDSMNQAFEMTGRWGTTYSRQEFTPWGKPQTAMLLVARRPISNKVTLTFSPPLATPVRWRAVGVVVDAQPPDNYVPAITTINGPFTLPDASTDLDVENAMRMAFFASGMDLPRMSNTGIKLPARVTDPTAGVTNFINSYIWNQRGAVATGSGPWFYAQIRLIWNFVTAIGERPPPTDSDDFWAVPAPCDAADILLINNNLMAPTWDLSQTEVFEQPDSLLLNFTEADGTRWMLNDLEGWWTLPPPALPDLPRPGYLDGSFPVDGRYEPRIITMRGTFWPGNNVNVAVPRLRLLRSLDAVRGGALLVVKEPVWPKQAWVWLSDQPRVNTVDLQGKTEFEVQLKAIDPIKYHSGVGGLRTYDLPYAGALDGRDYTQSAVVGERFDPNPFRRFTAGAAPVTSEEVLNSGTASVFPRFFIYGPATNAAIVNRTTGQRMVFQGTVQQGKMLIVDCYWRVVVLADATKSLLAYSHYSELEGENRRWMLRLSSPWIHLKPGINEMFYQASNVNLPPQPTGPTGGTGPTGTMMGAGFAGPPALVGPTEPTELAEPTGPTGPEIAGLIGPEGLSGPTGGTGPTGPEIPTDMTQVWLTFRSGWMGS